MTMKDVACLLILFKYRHRLSIQCMSDLLALLMLFGVNNVPRSWHQLKHLIETATLETSCFFSCSCCDSASINSSKCSTCGHNFSSDVVRNSFLTVPIKHQLEIILNNNIDVDLFSKNERTTICDVQDGHIYQQLKWMHNEYFLTLTMNVDGVQIQKG